MEEVKVNHLCKSLLEDLIDQLISPELVKPRFVTSRKTAISSDISPTSSKVSPVDEEIRRQRELLVNNLSYVSGDRDRWRAAAESARLEVERLARENNYLALANKELGETVEDQARVCTVLAADLVEIIWSLTSGPSDQTCPVQQLQLMSFLRLARQALAQCGDSGAGGEEGRLMCGLLGCLVNLSSRPDTLLLLLSTEDGRVVVSGSVGMLNACKEQRQAELLLMLAHNLLDPEVEDGETFFTADMKIRLDEAASRWSSDSRARQRVRCLGDKVHLLLGGKGDKVHLLLGGKGEEPEL